MCFSGFLHSFLNFSQVAGTMLLRKKTTRRLSRESKLKELEIGEGSSLGTTKQLEYVPRLEPFIKTTTKKVFIQPLTFGDTETSTRSKVELPQWGDLFNRISRE
jgi:hypothetical protein